MRGIAHEVGRRELPVASHPEFLHPDQQRAAAAVTVAVIERGIELWTNPGDIVLSPYAGIGSEGFVALRSGRRFVGVELKKSYFEQAKRNLMAAEEMKEQKTLEFTEANGD